MSDQIGAEQLQTDKSVHFPFSKRPAGFQSSQILPKCYQSVQWVIPLVRPVQRFGGWMDRVTTIFQRLFRLIAEQSPVGDVNLLESGRYRFMIERLSVRQREIV